MGLVFGGHNGATKKADTDSAIQNTAHNTAQSVGLLRQIANYLIGTSVRGFDPLHTINIPSLP